MAMAPRFDRGISVVRFYLSFNFIFFSLSYFYSLSFPLKSCLNFKSISFFKYNIYVICFGTIFLYFNWFLFIIFSLNSVSISKACSKSMTKKIYYTRTNAQNPPHYNIDCCKFDLVFTKNLKIPVRNQKLHPEHLKERFQNTEEKEQFLSKN